MKRNIVQNLPIANQRHNFLGKILQSELRPRIEALVTGNDGEFVAPVVATIDPTAPGHCGFACKHCIMGSYEVENDIPDIEPQRLFELVPELKELGILAIELVEAEPTTHPSIGKFVARAAKAGFQIGITSNGIKLERFADVFAKTCSWVRISVDAASAETHAVVHGIRSTSRFKRIINATGELADYGTTAVGFSFLILENNVKEIAEAAKLAKELGCRYFQLKPCHNPHTKALPVYSSEITDLIWAQLQESLSLCDEKFSIIWPESLMLSLTGEEQKKDCNICLISALRLVITPYGVFGGCTYRRGENSNRIGSINEEINEQLLKKLAKSTTINPKNDCNFFCARYKATRFLEMLKQGFDEGIDMLSFMPSVEFNPPDWFI